MLTKKFILNFVRECGITNKTIYKKLNQVFLLVKILIDNEKLIIQIANYSTYIILQKICMTIKKFNSL